MLSVVMTYENGTSVRFLAEEFDVSTHDVWESYGPFSRLNYKDITGKDAFVIVRKDKLIGIVANAADDDRAATIWGPSTK